MSRRPAVCLALALLTACGGASKPAASPPKPGAEGANAAAARAPEAPPAPSEEDAPVPLSPRDPQWGSRAALVTIVEFADFQCPFCARAEKTMDALKEEYGPSDLRVVWKNVPLPFHPNARPAAEAAMGVFALGGADAFWKFHARAFAHQDALAPESYARWAAEANVDRAAFERGMAAHAWQAKVDEDAQLAKELGVQGTPVFLINGVPMVGAQSIDAFRAVVNDELKKAKEAVAKGTPRERLYATRSAENLKAAAEDEAEEKPDPRIYKVPVGSAPSRGPKDAPVTIVEYSDFQCPFCKRVEPTLEKIRETYGDRVRIVWKNMPLPFHARALPAAELALEARAQKGDAGFWAAHDALFASQPKLEDADLEAIARALKLDVAKTKRAIATNAHARAIEDDEAEADDFDAAGTPHFFVNGRRLIGARPYEDFAKAVDDGLARARELTAKGVAPAAMYDALTKDGVGPAEPEKRDVAVPADAPWRGAASGKVVIQEFADFQCPFCKRAEPTLDQLLKAYPGQIKIVWRDMPLSFHADAEPAAEAAREAYAQKGTAGFWKMHDLLYANQEAPDGLKREALERYGKEIGLDGAKLAAALDGHTHAGTFDASAKAAEAAGIRGTPSFVVNGYVIAGAQGYAKFRRAVERALAEARAGKR